MSNKHVLIVDTQKIGHHILWLTLVAKAFLTESYKVTLLVNQDISYVSQKILDIDKSLLTKITLIPSDLSKKSKSKIYFTTIANIAQSISVDEVFLNNFDTIASKLFRNSIWRCSLPKSLKGKISAVYHRPRPFDSSQRGLSNYIKKLGLKKVIATGFFKQFFFLNPFLVAECNREKWGVKIHYLPDPWQAYDNALNCSAELKFRVEPNKKVILQYGVGDKRKGTHYLLEALKEIGPRDDIVLCIAGVQKDQELLSTIEQLKSQFAIILINKYISSGEEFFLFERADFIAIPYVSHYGSSNILAKAAQHHKPVIASDYDLIGKMVTKYNLGVTFENANVASLAQAINKISTMDIKPFQKNMQYFANSCSYSAFNQTIMAAFGFNIE